MMRNGDFLDWKCESFLSLLVVCVGFSIIWHTFKQTSWGDLNLKFQQFHTHTPSDNLTSWGGLRRELVKTWAAYYSVCFYPFHWPRNEFCHLLDRESMLKRAKKINQNQQMVTCKVFAIPNKYQDYLSP